MTDIWSLVEPYLAAERLELDDVELSGGGSGRFVRVVIDGDDVNVDRLAELSRGLSRLLDNETDLRDTYQLEVTSPGLERKLRRPAHFRKSVGREVSAKVETDEGRRTFRGVLIEANDDSFTINGEEGRSEVPYSDVVSAKTIFRWEKAPKPGH